MCVGLDIRVCFCVKVCVVVQLTPQNGLIAMTVTAIALTGALLLQRGAMFAAVLGGL